MTNDQTPNDQVLCVQRRFGGFASLGVAYRRSAVGGGGEAPNSKLASTRETAKLQRNDQ
jgi:hypothetical protein